MENHSFERLWKTLHEDFIEETLYEDVTDIKNELLGIILHSTIGALTPLEKSKNVYGN